FQVLRCALGDPCRRWSSAGGSDPIPRAQENWLGPVAVTHPDCSVLLLGAFGVVAVMQRLDRRHWTHARARLCHALVGTGAGLGGQEIQRKVSLYRFPRGTERGGCRGILRGSSLDCTLRARPD